MARHNREGRGQDQFGNEYVVSYQPDWLREIKVARDLESGRQSTKILFRNEDLPQRAPGETVRTVVSAPDLGLTLQLALNDPQLSVRRITVEATVPEGEDEGEPVVLIISRKRQLPPTTG